MLSVANCQVAKYVKGTEFMYTSQFFPATEPKDVEHHSSSAKLTSLINRSNYLTHFSDHLY